MAKLVDQEEDPESVSSKTWLRLSLNKRWTFQCEDLKTFSPAERHARGAWVSLAADICREQGSAEAVSHIGPDREGEVWVRVKGVAWPPPPLESFFELDMLRLRLLEFGAPPPEYNKSTAQDLWRLTHFIESVFRIARWPWEHQLERPLSGDIDKLWKEGGGLSLWRAFNTASNETDATQLRATKLAAWWLEIRPSLSGILGERISSRLRPVDATAERLQKASKAAVEQGP